MVKQSAAYVAQQENAGIAAAGVVYVPLFLRSVLRDCAGLRSMPRISAARLHQVAGRERQGEGGTSFITHSPSVSH